MITAVDDLLRPLYAHLTAADQCYFLREYTSGRGFAHSETNRLILNLKKPPGVALQGARDPAGRAGVSRVPESCAPGRGHVRPDAALEAHGRATL